MQVPATIGLIAITGMSFAPPQSTHEFLKQLVGQRLILRHYMGSTHPKAKGRDTSGPKGGCDVAVEVTAIEFDKSSIRLQARNIGTPKTGKEIGNTSDVCANVDVISFQINGFDMDQPRDQAEKIIGNVLQTPEAYLAAIGIPWDVAPSSENDSPVDVSRPGVTAGKPVLFFNPYYTQASREAHTDGKVRINCVIGTDGLIHDPVIEKGLTKELNALALDALTFYRIQPAQYGGQAVALKSHFEFSFQLY